GRRIVFSGSVDSANRRYTALRFDQCPEGFESWAEVAGPPSPRKPAMPMPATVEIVPSVATFLTRWPSNSEMYTFPAASTATLRGVISWALMAGPPSPVDPFSPVPANDGDGSIGGDAAHAVISQVSDVQVTGDVRRQSVRELQLRAGGR